MPPEAFNDSFESYFRKVCGFLPNDEPRNVVIGNGEQELRTIYESFAGIEIPFNDIYLGSGVDFA